MRQKKTIVIFRLLHGEVIALFPYELGTHDPYTCGSYMHIGQHGATDPLLVIQGTKPANADQYADLAAELTRIGYDLDIRQRLNHGHALESRRRELKRLND